MRATRRIGVGFAAQALAVVVALSTVAMTLTFTARAASACSCAARTDAEAFAAADAVFIGAVDEIRTPSGRQYSSADPERFVFEVDRVFKGEVFARQSVVTAREGASCGLDVGPSNGAVVVFATRRSAIVESEDGELAANLCGGTRPVSVRALAAELGAGNLPRAGSSPIGDPSSPPWSRRPATVAWFVLGSAIAASIAIVARRRRTARPDRM